MPVDARLINHVSSGSARQRSACTLAELQQEQCIITSKRPSVTCYDNGLCYLIAASGTCAIGAMKGTGRSRLAAIHALSEIDDQTVALARHALASLTAYTTRDEAVPLQRPLLGNHEATSAQQSNPGYCEQSVCMRVSVWVILMGQMVAAHVALPQCQRYVSLNRWVACHSTPCTDQCI
jgi:hypothetical protein